MPPTGNGMPAAENIGSGRPVPMLNAQAFKCIGPLSKAIKFQKTKRDVNSLFADNSTIRMLTSLSSIGRDN
jgi:hypothetical protein